jgi:hypothetical protein
MARELDTTHFRARQQCVNGYREGKQYDQERVHSWHVENSIGFDNEKANADVRLFRFGEKRSDESHKAKPNSADDRTLHRSGCIRMTNEDVIDLYKRVKPGTVVVVLEPHQGNSPYNPRIASMGLLYS